MTRTTDLIRHGLSAKLNQLLDGLYVQVNAGTVPLRQVLRAGHTFTEIFNSQNRSIRVMGVRLRSELDHFLQATYSPADIAAFKQAYGTNLSDWLTHRVLAKTAMSDETIPTEADVLRIRSLVRLWVSGEADREAITPRMQALGGALAKFRPMEPVRVYRNERKQGEDGWKEQYDFATAWSTDIYDAKVFGDVDRRLVTAIAQPEDILVSIPMVEGWCQVYDLGIVDAEKQDELVMVPHPSFEAERQEIPDEAALAALKVELREKVVDAWDERTGEIPLPPNALAEAAKVLDRLPEEKVVALGEELGVHAPALKEASITDRACYWIAPSGLAEPAPEGHVKWCEDRTGKHYADSMRAFQPFFAEGWARAGAWAGMTYLHGRKLSQIHLEAMQRLVADDPVLRNETVLIDQTSPRIVWEVPFSDFTALNRLRDLRDVALRRAKLASDHLNNTCPSCGAHQTCRCLRAHHAHFPGGEVPATHDLCYECKQTTKQAATPSPVLTRALKTVYESDDLYLALDPHGPFDGGCLIAAKAIIRAAGGGELVRLVSDHNGGQTEHYGAKVRGAIYDFLGGFSSPAAWIAALRQAEGWNTDDYRVVSGYDPDSDILDDPHAEKEVAKLLMGAMAGPAKQASATLPMVTPVFTTRALEALHRYGLMSKRVTQAVSTSAAWAYNYAWGVMNARWPEGEAAIARSSERSVLYARSILKGRFPEAEATIAQDPRQAAIYANDTIKGRWPEGEAAISGDPTWAQAYARHVIHGRWPEGEAAIASDAKSAYLYTRSTLKARWPEGEHAIAKDAEYAYRYATDVIDGRFLEAEGTIALVGEWAYKYALHVMKSKWPLPHKALAERNIGLLTTGLLKDNEWAQYKRLPEPAEGKTASPVPVPFALVDAIVARVEAFIVAVGPAAREVHIPLKDLMAQWSPTTSVHTFAVRWTLGDGRVSASGGVGPEAFAMYLTGLDEQSILTEFSDRVRQEIRHFVSHELAHVFQWNRVGHDHMARNPLRNTLGDDRCNYELKAISTEMCDTYGRGLRSNPNLSVEEFLTNDSRWKNLLRGITESERRRIVRDLYSIRRTSGDAIRRDAGLLRSGNDAAPRRASARELTSRFLLSKTSAASMVLWHGGDLENPNDSDMSNKGGLRWEYGPGLYATTHYDTARKYAKGSRKLYRITLQQGSDANEHVLPMDAVQAFVDEHMAARAKRDVLRDATRYTEKGLRAAWFINIIKHYNALPASKSGILRKFLVDQGVDYEIVDNAYGWNERMVVIFNMKKVTNIQRVMPKEKLEEFDLPTTFKESSRRSKFLQPKTAAPVDVPVELVHALVEDVMTVLVHASRSPAVFTQPHGARWEKDVTGLVRQMWIRQTPGFSSLTLGVSVGPPQATGAVTSRAVYSRRDHALEVAWWGLTPHSVLEIPDSIRRRLFDMVSHELVHVLHHAVSGGTPTEEVMDPYSHEEAKAYSVTLCDSLVAELERNHALSLESFLATNPEWLRIRSCFDDYGRRRIIKDLAWTLDEFHRVLDAHPTQGAESGMTLQPKTSMVVFHGTPHDFEQFKTDRIGIGEGNQVYGWGLYFSDTHAVADYYRDSLSNASNVSAFIWQGKDYKAKSGPESHAISLAFFSGIPMSRRIAKEGLADAKAGKPYALEMGGEAYWSKMLEVANTIKSKREIKIRRGLIYEVDIPDDGRYLLWDSPLAAQPPAVAAALAKTDASLWRPGLKNPAIGGDFYRELKNSFLDKHPTNAEASKAASLYLLGLGIVGIKYLDADSRKAKHGSFNYVVFDDRFVKVVKKASQMTSDEARLDWLARHKVPVVDGRVVLYHATPRTTAPLIRAEGLRAGSLLALQPEKAVFQARRDRGLAVHEVVCFEVSIPVENLRCGMWASTANPVPPSSLREVSFDLKLAKFLRPKTAGPIPIPHAVVSEVAAVIEALVANGGGSASLPEGSWPPLSLVRTVSVKPPVAAPGRPHVSNAAIALKTRRIIIEVTGDLTSDLMFLSNDIAQAVCHELAHAYQAHQQGVDQFLKNKNRDKLMSPKVNQEVKAMATELCMSYTALLTHDPSLSVEDFLHDDWRWDQIRDAASPRGIQRILRDLYQVHAAGAPGQRHAGVLSLNAPRTSRVSKFLQPKTAGPAIDLQPLMREFMTALDPEGKFPLPTIKYVSRSGVEWLGICYSRSVTTDAGIATGVAGEILVQKGIAVDLNHLRSVVAHEVTHHVAVNEHIVGLPVDKISGAAAALSDAHGAHWLRVVERINAIYGAGFVTQFSDMESKTWEAKEVFLFIVEHPKSEVPFYSWSPSVNQKTVDTLIEQRAAGCGVYITKTTSRFLTQLTAKSPTWTHAATKAELDALTSTIQELQDTGANLFSTYASGVTKTRSTDNKPWTLVMATPKRNATSSWINAWAKTPGLTTGEAVDLGMVQRDGREVRTVKLRGEGDLLAALPKFNLHSILNLPGIASDRVMADDVQAQLRTYWESAATPKASKFLQPKQAQVVFHGSPHDFDQFSLDHFSKGEGASAYGYGLYFTSNEAVANYYKRTLSLGNMTIEGKPFKPRREILEILGAHRQNLPAAAEALKAFVKSGKYHNRYGHLTQARKAIKAIKDGTLDLGDNAGHLYAAQIPDDGSYLLWDEPLQNQPPKVKAAIKKIIPTLNRKDYGDFTPDMPVGFNLLYALMKAQGKSGPGFGGRETSMLLRSYGILGVKYLDQESRGAEAGQSYNYVVYDDADVRVVGKQAGGLPAGPRAWISPQGEVLNTYDAPHEDWALGYLQHQEHGEWTGGAADIAQGTLLSQGWARVGSMANLSGPVTYGEARRWTNTTFRAFQKLVTTTPTWQNKTVEVGTYLGPVTPVPLAEFLAANKVSDVLRPGKTAGMQDGERSDSRQLGKPLAQDPRIVERKIEYVKLYRAVAAGTNEFHDMDYCTLNKEFAIGHAEHGAAVDEEPYWVIEGVFPVGWIYEAYNPGEYFFHRKDGGSSRGKRIHVAEPEQ